MNEAPSQTIAARPAIDLGSALSTAEVAEMIGTSRKTVVQLMQRGRIPAILLPDKRWLTDRAGLQAFLGERGHAS